MGVVLKFINLPFTFHLTLGAIIRFLLIGYTELHDKYSEVKYTDVDYLVFTDAARYIVHGESPYRRHTYRYSPIIAYFLTPNIFIHPSFGKYLFSIFDILIAIVCKQLVSSQLRFKKTNAPSYCAQLWLYNPMSIAISTRGNADSISCFLIIMSLYFLLRAGLVRNILVRYSLAGICLGVSIHVRLYPLAFSLPMVLSLGAYDTVAYATSISDGLLQLLPNRKQVILTLSCLFTVIGLTYGMYELYGYEFLFETYIYHLFRKDTRHNLSIMFYKSYLTMDEMHFDLGKVVGLMFQIGILLFLSLKYGVKQDSLPFCLFCQAVVLVAFNSVMTSQYFIWFLSLLPLVAHCFKMSAVNASCLSLVWIGCQAAWLYFAYLLEFKNQEAFIYIWINSILLFGAHIYVLSKLIKSYHIGYGFGLLDYSKEKKAQ